MKRFFTLLTGLLFGVAYAFLSLVILEHTHNTVSIGYVFALPLIMGAIPALLVSKAQLKNYVNLLLLPWMSVLSFVYLCFLLKIDGLICLIIIIAPFLILGTLGTFLVRMIRLKEKGDSSKKLYVSLLLPFWIVFLEGTVQVADHIGTVQTKILVETDRSTAWEQLKNVKDIQAEEVPDLFIYRIGVPRPLHGELTCEGVGCDRDVRWAKNVSFTEVITAWEEEKEIRYRFHINPEDIPPNTLDDHVMVGGRYFDLIEGSYQLHSLGPNLQEITLTSTYRITSTVNFYGKYWANFFLDSLHESILSVIKNRAESPD